MRLEGVTKGRGLGKLALPLVGAVLRTRAPDIVRVLMYRPKLFGKPFSQCMQRALRGPSDWSVGHRELFAAFTSAQNNCTF